MSRRLEPIRVILMKHGAVVGIGWTCLVLGIAFACGPAPAQNAAAPARTVPPVPTLTGTAAWAALLGNTITGTTGDGPYSEYYTSDGTAIHVDREGREEGRWTLKGAGVCFTFPSDPDEQIECREIEVEGSRGAFSAGDGSRYPFDIRPGDAKAP